MVHLPGEPAYLDEDADGQDTEDGEAEEAEGDGDHGPEHGASLPAPTGRIERARSPTGGVTQGKRAGTACGRRPCRPVAAVTP
ncbi:hypothetical protein GCM10010361_42010 [Streptomyces olivaceiscleroticus]|uniref:Uncharacterized protein n=1 Tax=Streptomyces olivaceiscleroticus TaxID=68245 RepID=A0ABP3K7E9_9ACTN